MNTEAKLESKLKRLFPETENRLEAQAILDTYGQESYEQEQTRVRLAILKLVGSNPNIDKLKKYTSAAKTDYRDVLSWAEYPRQSKNWSAKNDEKHQLIAADLNEYQAWLNT